MAEKCAATIAMVLKPEQVIHLVSTIITTEPYPLNMGAIKMLHKVVEHWGRDAIEPHLSKVMPGLIKVNVKHILQVYTLVYFWLYVVLINFSLSGLRR